MISGATRVAGVIGDPVVHSRSPAIHNAAYAATGLDWVYVALPVPTGKGAAAVQALSVLGLAGINVTMPHKHDVIAACARLSPAAARLGAVNTVVVESDGSCTGHSTDGEGFLRSLHDAGLDPAGRTAVVLGAGGAARAVAAALMDAGALVSIAARREAAAAAVVDSLGGLAIARWPDGAPVRADLVVNATPLGMGADPAQPVEPVAGQWVADLVYHPVQTPLLHRARVVGAHPIDGLGMLVHQAALAFELWTGVPAPVEVMREAATGTQ